jgi:Arc/MetJ-type ribon-helix-helix transcriptional regulator
MNQSLKLPKDLRTFVEEQVQTQDFKSSNTCIAQVLRAEKKRLSRPK